MHMLLKDSYNWDDNQLRFDDPEETYAIDQ